MIKMRQVLSYIYFGRELVDNVRYIIEDEFIIFMMNELPI